MEIIGFLAMAAGFALVYTFIALFIEAITDKRILFTLIILLII